MRQPVERKAGIDHANKLALLVLDGLTVASHHLVGVGWRIQVHVWFGPAWLLQQFRHQIPVHKEVLVVFATALQCSYRVAHVPGVGREVAAIFLKVVWLECYRTGIEIGIVLQHAPAVHKHRVGLVGMSLYQPFGHLGGHLGTIKYTLYSQRCLVEYLRGMADGLLAHSLARLIEQETESSNKDKCGKHYHPDTNPDRELAADICKYFVHTRASLLLGY